MEASEMTEKIGDLIAENKINEAIAIMKNLFEGSPRLNEVLVQSARHKDLVKQINLGTISYENSDLTKNQIRFALLGILNEVEDHAKDPEIREEIQRFEFKGEGTVIQQTHSGQGDNVGGDKIISNQYRMRVGIIVVTIILATAAALLVPDLLPKPVPLKGYVISSGEKTVERAKVFYKGDDGKELETFSDAAGRFSFEDINTKKVEGFRLEAFFEGRGIQLDTQGREEGLGKLQLQLPPGDPPFDLTYFALEEGAITQVVEGKVDERVEQVLKTQPIIVRTPILEQLQALHQKYHKPWEYFGFYEMITFPMEKEVEDDWEPLLKAKKIIKYNEQWWRNPSVRQQVTSEPLPAGTLYAMVVEGPEFEYDHENQEKTMESFHAYMEYWKQVNGAILYPDAEELAGLRDHERLGFYSQITAEGMPEGFFGLAVQVPEPMGCSVQNMRLIYPKMEVEVVVLENNSTQHIDIDSFYIQHHDQTGLRSLADDEAALEKAPSDAYDLYIKHRLPPGEKLLIPLRIIFTAPDMISAPSGQELEKWVYGPSWKVKSVDVGIEQFAFRNRVAQSLLVQNRLDIGSCPYAFTYNSQTGEWEMEDHILYNVNAKSKERFDRIPLSRFHGELRIRELDPETSYLDYIQVDHVSADGVLTHYLPAHPAFRDIDGQYFVMEQGDQVTLQFPDFTSSDEGRFYLVSRGYYEVYPEAANFQLLSD